MKRKPGLWFLCLLLLITFCPVVNTFAFSVRTNPPLAPLDGKCDIALSGFGTCDFPSFTVKGYVDHSCWTSISGGICEEHCLEKCMKVTQVKLDFINLESVVSEKLKTLKHVKGLRSGVDMTTFVILDIAKLFIDSLGDWEDLPHNMLISLLREHPLVKVLLKSPDNLNKVNILSKVLVSDVIKEKEKNLSVVNAVCSYLYQLYTYNPSLFDNFLRRYLLYKQGKIRLSKVFIDLNKKSLADCSDYLELKKKLSAVKDFYVLRRYYKGYGKVFSSKKERWNICMKACRAGNPSGCLVVVFLSSTPSERYKILKNFFEKMVRGVFPQFKYTTEEKSALIFLEDMFISMARKRKESTDLIEEVRRHLVSDVEENCPNSVEYVYNHLSADEIVPLACFYKAKSTKDYGNLCSDPVISVWPGERILLRLLVTKHSTDSLSTIRFKQHVYSCIFHLDSDKLSVYDIEKTTDFLEGICNKDVIFPDLQELYIQSCMYSGYIRNSLLIFYFKNNMFFKPKNGYSVLYPSFYVSNELLDFNRACTLGEKKGCVERDKLLREIKSICPSEKIPLNATEAEVESFWKEYWNVEKNKKNFLINQLMIREYCDALADYYEDVGRSISDFRNGMRAGSVAFYISSYLLNNYFSYFTNKKLLIDHLENNNGLLDLLYLYKKKKCRVPYSNLKTFCHLNQLQINKICSLPEKELLPIPIEYRRRLQEEFKNFLLKCF